MMTRVNRAAPRTTALGAIAVAALLSAPVHAQSVSSHASHGAHASHAEHTQAAARAHCPMHEAKHGVTQDGAHGAQGVHGAYASHGAHRAHEAQEAHASHALHATDAAQSATPPAAQPAHAMNTAHRFAPGMLLQHADGLGLTAEQTAQLEALKAAHKADCERRMAATKAAESAAAAALTAESPSLVEYEALLLDAAKHKVDCRVDMARTTRSAKALLTPAQRAHIEHMTHTGH
jgi:hypothetical protein